MMASRPSSRNLLRNLGPMPGQNRKVSRDQSLNGKQSPSQIQNRNPSQSLNPSLTLNLS
jgi:hypothetical protein